jgi:hypothetical protein
MHVRQAEIATAKAVGELLVVHPQQVQHGGVEVVDFALVLDGVVAQLVRRAKGRAAPHAAARQPEAEAEGVVVAPVAALT